VVGGVVVLPTTPVFVMVSFAVRIVQKLMGVRNDDAFFNSGE
jgi:hypothetical protein